MDIQRKFDTVPLEFSASRLRSELEELSTGTAKFPIPDMIVPPLLSLFIRFLAQNMDQNSTITERQAARRKTRWGQKNQS